MSIRVLVIEDDEDLQDTLCRYLSGVGMSVRGIGDATLLDQQLTQQAVDVVVCDINLPGESGFSIAARLRLASRAGIVMLTARAQQEDRMLGLSLGADHYIIKPVNLRELELVIRNLHRRMLESGRTAGSNDGREPAYPDRWLFDVSLWTLTAPNGKTVQISSAEYYFLQCLVAHVGSVVSREELLLALNRPNIDTYGRNLDVTISRLRKKVEDACGEKLPVLSARGVGYVFTARAEISG